MEVFVLGDSISIHYGPYLKKHLDKHLNYDRKRGLEIALEDLDRPRGSNGGDSFMVLDYLKEQINNGKQFDILLLNCGAHDIRRYRNNLELQVNPEQYEKNLLDILKLLKNKYRKFFFINTCPINDEVHNNRKEGFIRYNEDIIKYNKIAEKIMTDYSIQIIDLYEYTKTFGENIYCDHAHFNEDVREKQGKYIAQIINKRIYSGT